MPTLTFNDVELHYEERGTGETIVFTHGASWDQHQWQPQVNALSNSYHTVTWDVRGHGRSTLPAGKVDARQFSRDLIALLDHLHVKQAHLCGLSMGGHISLQTAIYYPERVSSLILIGTPYTNSFNAFEKWVLPLNRLSSRFIPMSLLAFMQAKTLSRFNHENKAYIQKAVRSIPHERWIRLWQAISRMESGEQLQTITCPTLILHGEHDSMIMRQQIALHQLIPHSTLKIIDQAHHATNLDNPTQVNAEIRKHLHNLIYA
ncbi:pimeloyl-ACP methyl ester carboxylesterase [Alkalihalobacillus xiaoxiensis]|uniref:Pimeloyl-ACP methyl ester carboxylesterase n=1 Tax=Shouchella xiaoxiensis TaxID=766895 RepID=A0ABS2SSG2_9BACI|nr:alpha/beta hydrolase [Shouchella xiaoxiensis]MBM7837222.1 pimeloyl-ACP methyl ester carboxylesterase [Shouchella xiaoxiensis]